MVFTAPIAMGRPENFQPNYHGGSFPVPPLNGGTWPLGGTITYNGGTFDILSQIIFHHRNSLTQIHLYNFSLFLFRYQGWSGTWLVSMTQFNAFSCLLFKSDFMVCWYRNSVSRAPYTRTANLGGPGLMGGTLNYDGVTSNPRWNHD